MSDFMQTVGTALRTALTWELNGLLALLYVAWEHVALLVTAGACGWLLWGLPEGRREGGASQRPWLLGVGVLACLAAALAPAPVPILLAAMTVAGALAVRADRFNPDALRWRIVGGLALYAARGAGIPGLRRLPDWPGCGGLGRGHRRPGGGAGRAGPGPGVRQHAGDLGAVADPAAGLLLAAGAGRAGAPAAARPAAGDHHGGAHAGGGAGPAPRAVRAVWGAQSAALLLGSARRVWFLRSYRPECAG